MVFKQAFCHFLLQSLQNLFPVQYHGSFIQWTPFRSQQTAQRSSWYVLHENQEDVVSSFPKFDKFENGIAHTYTY